MNESQINDEDEGPLDPLKATGNFEQLELEDDSLEMIQIVDSSNNLLLEFEGSYAIRRNKSSNALNHE